MRAGVRHRIVGHAEVVERLLVRDTPNMKLRVVLGPPGRGSVLPGHASVEWVGLAGDPSSYGLIAGARASSSRIALSDEGPARYRGSLAGRADTVVMGLPGEYRSVVLGALADGVQAVMVSRAAHGEVGSSAYVFAGLTRFLARVLAGGLPTDDQEVWRLLDSCWLG